MQMQSERLQEYIDRMSRDLVRDYSIPAEMYENQDMFDSAFFDSNRFKALQHYTGILNDTTNYGKAENGGVGIRNLTSYGRAGKKRQKPTT